MNKNKIFNDPVYGFVSIHDELIFDLVEHPYFQRLRRIKQLGLTDFVYPGALHTRFHHALGAMHLMHHALENLKDKGHEITDKEQQGAMIAILLHDIGHGPFSHALEAGILPGVAHEKLSLQLMKHLNKEFNGALSTAIAIFEDRYPRPFLHQLVSSQLDIDRLDYLQRDCFFTGVSEGTIGADRIIKMITIVNDELVVEEKGIYSIENFLNARRLMYWQVYLHKTATSAEQILIQIFRRAKKLALEGKTIDATPALKTFLYKNITFDDFQNNKDILRDFSLLDDYDIWGSVKYWQNSNDFILSDLSRRLLERKLFKVVLSNDKFDKEKIAKLKKQVASALKISEADTSYYILKGKISNSAYIARGQNINIITKEGEILDVAKASDLPNITAISKIVKKHYLCWPKNIFL